MRNHIKYLFVSGRMAISAFVLILQTNGTVFCEELSYDFKSFVLRQGLELRKDDRAPKTIDEWNERRTKLREQLLKAWGGFPATDCDLEPRKLGEFQRDGYRVE